MGEVEGRRKGLEWEGVGKGRKGRWKEGREEGKGRKVTPPGSCLHSLILLGVGVRPLFVTL